MDGRQSGEVDAVVQYACRRRRDIDKSQRGAGQNADVTDDLWKECPLG